MRKEIRYAARLWYYLRVGFSTYLSWGLAAVNTLVVVWYLAIKEVPAIESLFGHFIPFAVFASIIGVPIAIGIGWVHMKRSPAYVSEVDITVEANPYNYKLPPGYIKEALYPFYLELLVQQRKVLEAQGLLTEGERIRIEDLARKLRVLIDGGIIGTPRAKL